MLDTVPTIVRRAAPKSPPISRALLRKWGNAMLGRLDRSEAELSVLLTNDRMIRLLNRDYRDKDRPTDVLSFHFASGSTAVDAGCPWLLGDIVISLDTAARQAKGRMRSLEAEVRWLLAHGILHLCGYDHASAAEKREMVAWTRRLVIAAERNAPLPNARSKRARPRTSTALSHPKRKGTRPSIQ